MTPTRSQAATVAEAGVVVLVCFGWFIYASVSAMQMDFPADGGNGGAVFSDSSFLAMGVMELVFGGIALTFLRWRGQPASSVLPRPTWLGSAAGIALCFGTLVLWWLMSSFFSPAQHAAQPVTEMVARATVSMPAVLLFSLVNGVYEETFVLGYLMRSFEAHGAAFAIGISVLVRLLYHVYQGPIGALSACLFGTVMSLVYWRTRLLWPAAFAHALADVLAFS